MIERVDRELQEWIRAVVPGIEVVLGAPNLLAGKHGVSLYLLAFVDPPMAWMNRKPSPRVALRYLLTTWAENDEEAHHLLGELLLAVMEQHEYELDLSELPATLWTNFGIAPRPALTLRVPLYSERKEATVRLVRGPLVVRGAPVRSLRGIVLGPGDIPVAGAEVELPSLHLRDHTDARGHFHFSTVPAEPQSVQLLVKARGRAQSVTVEQAASDKEPVMIQFDLFDTP